MIRNIRNNGRGRKDEEYIFPNEYNQDYVPTDYDEDGDIDDTDRLFWDEYDSDPVYIPNEEPYEIEVNITHGKDNEKLSFDVDATEYDYIKDLSREIKSALERIGAEFVR